MDEAALQRRLRRVERLQYLVIALLAGPYLLGVAELIGRWVAAVLGTVAVVVALAVGIYRSRGRSREHASG
jgi:hypothetical protein